jgi:hypothetical protein
VLRKAFATRGEGRLPRGYNKFPAVWTDQEWAQLLDVFAQVENDRSIDGSNKHDLRAFPRHGHDKVPWLWRPDACPDDVNKECIFREFRVRLHTMETMCNFAHKTIELPATLFIEYVVQWFETGGKCHVFGFTMTPFCNHLTKYSIGRDVRQLLKDGSTRLIKAGAPMASDCTVLFPTDIHKHYNRTLRTIIFESWKANALRFRWRVSNGLIGLLETITLDTADSTKWFSDVGQPNYFPATPFPKHFRVNNSVWVDSLTRGKAARVIEIEDDDLGEVDNGQDEELDVRGTHISHIQFAKDIPADLYAAEKGEGIELVKDDSAMWPPESPDDIEARYNDDMQFLKDLRLQPGVQEDVMNRVLRWMYAGKSSLLQAMSAKGDATKSGKPVPNKDDGFEDENWDVDVEESPSNPALLEQYELLENVYLGHPAEVGKKGRYCLQIMKNSAMVGDAATFRQYEVMFKKELLDGFLQ